VHRLGGFDATLLLFESPSQPMHACSLAELDVSTMPGGYSFEAFREMLAVRTRALPEFRAKVVDSRLNLGTPVWAEDPNFDIDNHVHRLDLPAPGGQRELCDIAGRLASEPLDRSRPLWDMWVLEGVSGVEPKVSGRIALVIRTHHVFADGLTSGDLWAKLYASDTDAPATSPVDGFGDISPQRLAVDGLLRFAARPWFLLTRLIVPTLVALARTVGRAVRGRAMSAPFLAPRIPFNGDVSERRNVAYARLDLRDVKTVKNTFGVKVNDVLLAVVSGAVRQFLESRGALPDRALVALIPVAVQDGREGLRNQFAPMWSSLHTDLEDPVGRLKAIAESSSVAKEHSSAIGTTLLADWAHCAPSLPPAIMRLYAWSGLSKRLPVYSVSLSNVRGDQQQILGAHVIANYPFGPVMNGAGLNITAASLNGNIDCGLVSCPELLPDLWEVADAMPVALKELLNAAH